MMALHTVDLIDLKLVYRGKTRDTYDLGNGLLLIVATDRISTHNIVHESAIPRKGQVLTALTVFWMSEVLTDIPNHLVDCGNNIYDYLPRKWNEYPNDLPLRSIVVRRLRIIPVEFIFRAYLAGSLYSQFYSKGKGNPYGVKLADNLPKMFKFDSPIFTPTEKSGTDEPINQNKVERPAYELALKAFTRTRKHANLHNVEIVDSKFEIGVDDAGRHYLADEVSTPDSSRFALTSQIKEGVDPPWLDKQIARDEAERVWGQQDGQRLPIKFAPLIVDRLVNTYEELFRHITGMKLIDFQVSRL